MNIFNFTKPANRLNLIVKHFTSVSEELTTLINDCDGDLGHVNGQIEELNSKKMQIVGAREQAQTILNNINTNIFGVK